MVHTSYFDHVYPTVNYGDDGNTFVIDYLGRSGRPYNMHDGHDYAFPDRPVGTPILAAASGTAFAYSSPGFGVVIRHDGVGAGYETIYWHLNQFADAFRGKVDNGVGVRVEAGMPLGTSGNTGRSTGPHLHFEVRYNGKQIDPYGWYGPGPDPCPAWEGCGVSVWLWHDALSGMYDFTRPDSRSGPVYDDGVLIGPGGAPPALDITLPPPELVQAEQLSAGAPIGSLAVSPDPDLRMLVHFDGNAVPMLGRGAPFFGATATTVPQFAPGVFDGAVRVAGDSELTYATDGNLPLERGTVALWVQIPQNYPESTTNRHYLWTASASPSSAPYTNTLALRREVVDGAAQWNFWTVGQQGERHDLMVADTLEPGTWHHLAVTWDQRDGRKALYLDGELAANATDATLPTQLGEWLQIGRFTSGFGASEALLDELGVWSRVLSPRELAQLAAGQDPYTRASGPIATARVVTGRTVLFHANAYDQDDEIVSMQVRRNDDLWSAPMPYYETYRWTLTDTASDQTFTVKYHDAAENATVVTTTLKLVAPLIGIVKTVSSDPVAVSLVLDVENIDVPAEYQPVPAAWYGQEIEMQLSQTSDFSDVFWMPYTAEQIWKWQPDRSKKLYIRFRDRQGRVSEPILVEPQ